MTVTIFIERIIIPPFVRKLPFNILDQLIGTAGGSRLQRSIAEHLRHAWKIKVPLYFHRRSDLGLSTTGQFENAFTYKISRDFVDFLVRPCLGSDGFNYAQSLIKGRKGISGRHYTSAIGKLVRGGEMRGTTDETFQNLMESLRTHFDINIGIWGREMLDRAARAAGGRK